MPKINSNNISFDSELELNYYNYLKENNIKFIYQNEYKKIPLHIDLGRRKNYVPDFIVFDNKNKSITIVELKGWNKWSGNEDDNIMNFMKNKVITNVDFLIDWLNKIGINCVGYDIDYKRLKYLKKFGFVDYDFKNPNSLINQKRKKIEEQINYIKELELYKKECERYFNYLNKEKSNCKLTKIQINWLNDFRKSKGV